MQKKIFVVILNIAGFSFVLLALLFISFESSIDHTMTNNKEIDLAFRQTNELVGSLWFFFL